jgi:hypothetical protein
MDLRAMALVTAAITLGILFGAFSHSIGHSRHKRGVIGALRHIVGKHQWCSIDL